MRYNPPFALPEGVLPKEYPIYSHEYDVVVIGGGGAGLRAGVSLAERGFHTACLSKLFPTRSHTVAATGGINAALGNMGADDWRFHYYDTVKSSQGLGDLPAIRHMCEQAASAVYSLEHYGMPFSRNAEGRILQTAFGGQTTHYGRHPAYRCARAGDKTGHSMLQTLTSRAMQVECRLLVDYTVMELIMVDGACKGVVAFEMKEGALHRIQAHNTVIATGGCGRIYQHTTQAYTCTGDGLALVSRAGLPNQDLEFVQFHPTCLYGSSFILTDRLLEEGGVLVNSKGQRFVDRERGEKEKEKGNSGRDVVCRAMALEIKEGRGAGPRKDHLFLDLTNISREDMSLKFPGVAESIKVFAGVDSFKEKVPVVPAAHYTMGGIPTDTKARVISNTKGDLVPGLYAAGEAACVSVHGANRLPANSLLDILVFGKAAADSICEVSKPGKKHEELPDFIGHNCVERIERIRSAKGSIKLCDIRDKLQEIMQKCGGVLRNEASLKEGILKIQELPEMLKDIRTVDRGLLFNMEIIDGLELENLILVAKQTLAAALERQESRGAHVREDFPERNDKVWRKHSLTLLSAIEGDVGSFSRPVNLTLPDLELPDLDIKSI